MEDTVERIKFFFYLLILFSVASSQLLPQSYYRSVADVDSFSYVTMDDKILILKRDAANELIFIDSISFDATHRADNFNSAIIIDDYLLVGSKDSVVLFSISERENPEELNRIYISSIIRLNRFGNYCLVHSISNSTLFSIENDSLKFLITHPRTINNFPYVYRNTMSLSYPYLINIYTNFGENYMILEKYSTEGNYFYVADSIKPPQGYILDGVISQSTNIFTVESNWIGSNNYQDWFRYIIVEDSITLRNRLCNWFTSPVTGTVEGYQVNDQYGVGLFAAQGFKIFNPGNPCNGLTPSISANPSNYFTIGNSVYRIGNQGFYYLYQGATFHAFQFPPVSVENENNQIPNKLYLEQNYPNPFNPNTIISWQSPVGSWQTLKVYDVLGRVVATLIEEYREAGYHEVEFNSAGLASGVYYYQLKAGNFVESKKLVLLK